MSPRHKVLLAAAPPEAKGSSCAERRFRQDAEPPLSSPVPRLQAPAAKLEEPVRPSACKPACPASSTAPSQHPLPTATMPEEGGREGGGWERPESGAGGCAGRLPGLAPGNQQAGGRRTHKSSGGTYQAGSLGPGAVLLLPLVFHVCISLRWFWGGWGASGGGVERAGGGGREGGGSPRVPHARTMIR